MISRRDFLKTSGSGVAGASLLTMLDARQAPALVLERPVAEDGLPAEPYILVCPSTDPAWVPLFVRARGLVMETGGVLSHGAIVLFALFSLSCSA